MTTQVLTSTKVRAWSFAGLSSRSALLPFSTRDPRGSTVQESFTIRHRVDTMFFPPSCQILVRFREEALRHMRRWSPCSSSCMPHFAQVMSLMCGEKIGMRRRLERPMRKWEFAIWVRRSVGVVEKVRVSPAEDLRKALCLGSKLESSAFWSGWRSLTVRSC